LAITYNSNESRKDITPKVFEGFTYDNINFFPQKMLDVIDRILNGERNATDEHFFGDGEQNHLMILDK
jgi:hypothetical protein